MAGVMHGRLETAAHEIAPIDNTPPPPRKPPKRREQIDRPRGSTRPSA